MKINCLLLVLLLCVSSQGLAHQGEAKYLANEAVLATFGDTKVLFDPFFHESFGTYQLVPEHIKQAILAGTPPFDDIDAIVISHAHDDHFAADEVLNYLKKFSKTKLIAPQQAVDQLFNLESGHSVANQITAVDLAFEQKPISIEQGGLTFEALRIPHAGWPARAEVENLVFRVTLTKPESQLTVMHLGDADVDDSHYLKHKAHWQKRLSHTAFVPYWFFYSAEGRDILAEILNIEKSIGVHVPVKIPKVLTQGKADYFSKPGETRIINATTSQ
ncbi:MBL fold metallo-hydrolase [Paraglaciecola aestuariivivens]